MTTENNKLIAEFLGWEEKEKYFMFNPKTNGSIYIKTLLFHSDWNWLMQVVEKIETIPSWDKDRFGTIVTIQGKKCRINSDHYQDKNKTYSKEQYFDVTFIGETKIEAVYNACIEFIKWYNK